MPTTRSKPKPKKATAATPAPQRAAAAVTTAPLSAFKPDANNARVHTDASQRKLTKSLEQLGAGRSVVADRKGVIRAGNGTLAAAQAAGFTEALVVKPAAGQLVVVQRDDWTDREAKAYALADNKHTDNTAFDPTREAEQLVELHDAGVDLESIGLEPGELDGILESLAAAVAGDQGGAKKRDEPANRWQLTVTLKSATARKKLAATLRKQGFAVVER